MLAIFFVVLGFKENPHAILVAVARRASERPAEKRIFI
jgi:hypothetical protein